MHKSLVALVIGGLLAAGCGKNQVTVEIRGGDGNKVRLDINYLQLKFNRLVPAGTYPFPPPDNTIKEIKQGTFIVTVAAEAYLERQVVEIDSPPFSGVKTYPVNITVPAGTNTGFKREGTILYAATRTSVRNWDLFTIKADGSAPPVQLTNTREFEQHPCWSPDGKKILYTSGDVMTNIDIFAMDADGTNLVRLTDHPERDQRACWSPDGRQIAFTSQRDGDVAVWIMDADGGNPRKLVQGREPSWSPDGRQIAFTSAYFEGWDEIYSIEVDGSNMKRLTVDKDKFDVFPRWSPDGRRLVFDTERFGGQELMLMKPDGADPLRITVAVHTFEAEPVWSPDGRGLAYMGKMKIGSDGNLVVDDKGRPQGAYDIYIMAATGFDWDEVTTRDTLPINLTNTEDWDEWSPSWRPF